jgi:putative membrane protein insertion efficiency factor
VSRLARLAWTTGAPVRLVLIAAIRAYRVTLGGLLGGQCRFYPTCSMYAEEAIASHGAVRGLALAVWRIARCGPFTAGGVDHVPAPHRHAKYDSVTQVAA